MQAVNKKMDPQKTLQTMQNFQKENMKMEMTEEMSKCWEHLAACHSILEGVEPVYEQGLRPLQNLVGITNRRM